MQFKKTKFKNLYEIDFKSFLDDRGQFTKIYSKEKIKKIINFDVKQINISHSLNKGTFRGLHYQIGKFSEKKIIYCLEGKIMDYAINIQKNSSNYLKIFNIEIGAKKNNGLLLPEGYAHGFQTLSNNTTVVYMHDKEYSTADERAIRYNDPLINIKLPIKLSHISERDLNHPEIKI
jgi:dTDP-4-dehydrorhamnose 3,5-epimerase